MISGLEDEVEPYLVRHRSDPEWITSRLQMYWKTKFSKVYVDGMDFSHGEGKAPVATVRFSGSRDWDTDYLVPAIEDILPFMDDPRGLFLQNGVKEGMPWEWVHPAKTGHIIERINEKILKLAESAAFLYWFKRDERYAVFASDILLLYMEGMYHRDPPTTIGNHRNAKLMGLQTFEVIHERIVVPITICYDFLHDYLLQQGKDLHLITTVLKKWVEQEIKFGVPGNNWNLMQARYITYLALVLEGDDQYDDGRGQQYYLDQMLHQNSEKQKALVEVLKIFDQETAIWPETAGYSTGVSEDILEIICLIDRVQHDNLLQQYPLVEKSILASFEYLFPNGVTVAFGDAKHRHLRFNALELLISQYRKYGQKIREALITSQLKNFMVNGAYHREEIESLFDMFMHVEELIEVPPADGISAMVTPLFYAENVSWLTQRNGLDPKNGMMISLNASKGNHSHANGINIELYAQGMVFAPDCAAGVSYWSEDHHQYYSRFPSHNTVIVDGKSDYRTMMTDHPFTLKACYPGANKQIKLHGPYTFTDVTFLEPSTNASQRRLTGTVRTSASSGYFIDIFRSSRLDGQDRKHEYLFHGQGKPIELFDASRIPIQTASTDELSSSHGDLVGYDYFKDKQTVAFAGDFIAQFSLPALDDHRLESHLWMQGFPGRKIFTVLAPPSRALSKYSVPGELIGQPMPTLVVQQAGEARSRPFVAVIETFESSVESGIRSVDFFPAQSKEASFVGIKIRSSQDQEDFIFNDEYGLQERAFDRFRFQGTYGIISYVDTILQNLFLGEGT